MAKDQMGNLIDCLRRAVLAGGETDLTDGQLLECFINRHDEAALAALVRRHGPMVWGVCQRVLRNHHDTEDAFQATFLVLVRKAASIMPRDMVGNWLYGVAHQTARKARASTAKRQAREKQVTQMPEPEAVTEPDLWHDLEPLLDQELSRLPDKYRVAVVLCDLEGKSRKEAARQLKIPEGTLSSRLTTARTKLAKRLTRHGLAVSGGALAAVLSQKVASASVPTSVVSSTIKAASLFAADNAAAGIVSIKVAALTEGVLKTMLLKKITAVAAVLSVVVALSGAAGLIYQTQAAEQPKAQKDDSDRGINAEFQVPERNNPAPKRVFPNAVGWSWFEAPRLRTSFGAGCSMASRPGTGFSAIFEEDKDGAFVVYLAYESNKEALEYRPIVFDKEGKRYHFSAETGVSHHNIHLNRFRLDPKKRLPLEKAVYMGIEMLTPDGRKAVAHAAGERARKEGIDVLPMPEAGSAYRFTLRTMDGKKIRADDFRGKVVVIDCWATWCSPCMSIMPELKQLYEKHHKVGLEIIGVCFDRSVEQAKKAVESNGLSWQQVLVPTDEKIRGLWREASGIEAIPRLLIIDRDGILRVDAGPGELEGQIAKLLKGTAKQSSNK